MRYAIPPEHYFKWLAAESVLQPPAPLCTATVQFITDHLKSFHITHPPSPLMSSLSGTNTQIMDNNTPSLFVFDSSSERHSYFTITNLFMFSE
jgi:hypothetical protein